MNPEPEPVEELLRAVGVPEETIERARGREDPLSALFESMPVRGPADRTVTPAQIESGGGMPATHSQELMRAFGLPSPAADEPAFTPAEARALTDLWRHQDIWPFESGVQIARLYGRLLARIAQASVAQWLAMAEPRLRAAEPDAGRRTIAAADSVDRLLPVADTLLAGVHRRWVERETAQIAVRAAESGPATDLLSGVTQVSILFCDLKDVHASVHHGAAVPREGDYFGQPVNLAVRLLVLAERDELLATTPVVERSPEFEWEHCGSERVRGFSDEVEVHRLRDSR